MEQLPIEPNEFSTLIDDLLEEDERENECNQIEKNLEDEHDTKQKKKQNEITPLKK